MKTQKKHFIIFTLILFLLCIVSIGASTGRLRVFLDNREVPVKTIVSGGQVYVSLQDLAHHFPGQMHLDAGKGRLDITSYPAPPAELPQGKEVPEEGISGTISVQEKGDREFFLKNVKVVLYGYNANIPDDMSLAQLKRLAEGKDSEYLETHGAVREAVSDAGGRFYLSGIPAGKYEVASIYYTAPNQKGLFWRKVVEVERNKPIKVKLDTSNAYSF